jgi:hypothetical protein
MTSEGDSLTSHKHLALHKLKELKLAIVRLIVSIEGVEGWNERMMSYNDLYIMSLCFYELVP